jgi:hypothetical protein
MIKFALCHTGAERSSWSRSADPVWVSGGSQVLQIARMNQRSEAFAPA